MVIVINFVELNESRSLIFNPTPKWAGVCPSMSTSIDSIDIALSEYLSSDAVVSLSENGIPECEIPNPSPELLANSYYFGHPEWAKTYFEACHRHEAFKERWIAATEGWDNKIVVDIGCGPGNLYAALGGQPKL